MREINGVTCYGPNEPLSLPEDFPPIPDDNVAIFGFKIKESGNVKEWVHATEEDFRGSEKLLGTRPERIDELVQKQKTKPDCSNTGGSCMGMGCPTFQHCGWIGHPGSKYVRCGCTSD